MRVKVLSRLLRSIAAPVVFTALTAAGWAQSGSQGTIVVTIQDDSGGVVRDASLRLVESATNDTRTAKTRTEGTYTFVNLPIGVYKLAVTKQGYETTLQPMVIVQAAQTTDVHLALRVGAASETVTVNAAGSPLLETTQNSLVTVIDPQFVEDLPMIGRDLGVFATLVPGYAGVPSSNEGAETGQGSWNGKVVMDGGSDIDGVMQASSRFKGQGVVGAGVTARLENISEMAVQSDQIDVDQGFGQNSMQVSFVSRSGTNQFHGRIFADLQNDGLNANTWTQDAEGVTKNKLIYIDYGVSAGGPIIKDKMFFYGTFATRTIPGSYTSTATALSSNAQAGNFSWIDNGVTYNQNLYQLAAAQGVTLNTAPDANVATQMGLIDSNAIPAGHLTMVSGDNNIGTLSYHVNDPTKFYFPLARVDYNLNPKLRMGLSWTMTKQTNPNAFGPFLPGSSFAAQNTGYFVSSYIASYRLDWDVSPTLTNEYRLGFNYSHGADSPTALKSVYTTQPQISWGLGTSGQSFYTPQSNEYPIINMSDTLSWQKKAHTLKFGFSGYREQDHYWNPPNGYWDIGLGMVPQDPAYNAFTQATLPNATPSQVSEAQSLYATLTGRVNGIYSSHAVDLATGGYNPGVAAFNLNELSMAWGLYAQDSWRITPTLTINYGLRWDFTGEDHDLNGVYHNVEPASIYGPTPVGDLFHPGDLGGLANPVYSTNPKAYNPDYTTPQPQAGFAWNPHADSNSFWGKLLDGSDSVLRGGASLKRFTEPYQSFWIWASDQGSFFYNTETYNPSPQQNGAEPQGFFAPGSLTLSNATANYPSAALLQNFVSSPSAYATTVPEAQFTYLGGPAIYGMNPKIPSPTVISWNLGAQRKLGATRAMEIRYVANRSYHQWYGVDTNEVNVFENGFLSEFKLAQQNQLINYANQQAANPGQTLSTTSFQNLGASGQSPLPILETAFPASQEPSQGSDWTNGALDLDVANGAVGAMASALTNPFSTAVPAFCNLVGGSQFSPCQTALGASGGTGPYPINVFQANPYGANNATSYMTAFGYSTYEALQTELRQQAWHGLQMEANYTWSHTLGNGGGTGPGGGLYVASPVMTLHNVALNYHPATFDIHQVFHGNGTYDLPVGRGKQWLSSDSVASRVLGNWIIGSIVTMQTGTPTQLMGGWQTYNDYADGGLSLLNGLTVKKLQKAVGVHRVPLSALGGVPNYVLMFDPKYLNSSTAGGANTSYILPNTTPGVFGAIPYIYGPHGFYQDVSFSKGFPIFRETKVKFQAEMSNIWNHPVFGNTGGIGDVGAQDTTFGELGGPSNAPRAMDMRLNIEF